MIDVQVVSPKIVIFSLCGPAPFVWHVEMFHVLVRHLCSLVEVALSAGMQHTFVCGVACVMVKWI